MTDADHTPDPQFASYTTGDGDVVVYDRHNPAAWIQSSHSIRLGEATADEQNA